MQHDPAQGDARIRIDATRADRTGAPEIVYAETKTTMDVVASLRALADANGRGIASRLKPDHIEELERFAEDGYALDLHAEARIAILVRDDAPALATGRGKVAVIAAGTSDRPVATEATIIAREMGCEVMEIHDVGAAGLHRLVAPLRHVVAEDVDVIIVAAGMDGALPTVVAGLVDIPVIGLPVSTGYGAGGDGMAALLNMLQSCAPGLVVVNIDNGIGAAITAALIARRRG
jgi:hypothetical protein